LGVFLVLIARWITLLALRPVTDTASLIIDLSGSSIGSVKVELSISPFDTGSLAGIFKV